MRPQTIPLALLLVGLGIATTRADEPVNVFALESGEYALRVKFPDFPKKDEQDQTFAAKVTVEPPVKGIQNLLVKMRRTDPPHTTEFRGIVRGNAVKLLANAVEHDEVLSMHLIGALSAESKVSGKVTVMVDGAIALRGEWELKKPEEPPAKVKHKNDR